LIAVLVDSSLSRLTSATAVPYLRMATYFCPDGV